MYQNPEDSKKWTWYTSNSEGYSIATDVLKVRETFNKSKNNTSRPNEMPAYSPPFMIGIESGQTKSEGQEKQTLDNNDTYIINNMNFGIITIPKISLGIEKNIVNVKLTNTQGNIIINENPIIPGIKYMSNLDSRLTHISDGSNFAKIEISNEEIYGSKLEITYAITILNDSNLNFWEQKGNRFYGYYYKFGDSSHSNEVTITINKIDDYLDKELELTGFDHSISNLDSNEKPKDSIQRDLITAGAGYNVYDLEITGGWKQLYTQRKSSNSNMLVSGKIVDMTQDTATIVATKTLSNDSKDSYYVNQAEVVDIEVSNNPLLVEDINEFKQDDQYTNYFTYGEFINPTPEASLTIVPPTGTDKLTVVIYMASGIILLVILTVGVIIIKKKVINK